jgi:hypothetical protein
MAAMKSLKHDLAPEAPISCPYPLGASVTPEGINFSIFSASAKAMQIVLFDHPDDPGPAQTITLDPVRDRTSHYWHIVRSPSLDLANRDLITAYLHAVWLAESNQRLDSSIIEVLDRRLEDESPPLRSDIQTTLKASELTVRAKAPMTRILQSIAPSLTPENAVWFIDPDGFVQEVATSTFSRFDDAFGCWRQLYQSARAQLLEAQRKLAMTVINHEERVPSAMAVARYLSRSRSLLSASPAA